MHRKGTRTGGLGTALTTALGIGLAVVVALVVTGRLTPDTFAGDQRPQLAPPSARPSLPGVTRPAGSQAGSEATRGEIAKYYAAIQKNGDDVDSYVALGFAYLQNVREVGDPGDYGRADTAFKEALKRAPTSAGALLGQAQLALARHEFRAALELAQRLLKMDPNDRRALGPLADAQTELGLYDEAAATVQRMVDLRPDLPSYSRVSYQRELRGQIDGAQDGMRRAFNTGAANLENREYIRVLIGNLYFLKGDVPTAEAVYRASLNAYPDYVYALAGMARVHAARGEFDEAIELFQRAVDRIPLPEFVIGLGETQEAAGRIDDARSTYQLVALIQDLFKTNGVNTDLELALFEANHGADPARAVQLARAAYADQPNIKAADALGWALYKSGSYDEAAKYAGEALKLGTRDGLFMFHAGMIAKARGDTSAAADHLTRALEQNHYFSPLYGPQARSALEELGKAVPAVPSFPPVPTFPAEPPSPSPTPTAS
jgi:tetratricopeptide (TPR) repeat protein